MSNLEGDNGPPPPGGSPNTGLEEPNEILVPAPSTETTTTTLSTTPALSPPVVPAEHKKEGKDWFVLFNPKVKKVLDINLVHNLRHESIVCCVHFSADGKYLATGCNQTAQIYDVKTGKRICVFVDEKARKGDTFIRSVRFSPDGRYLATGAEDRKIRIWDIRQKCIHQVFVGHQQEIYSLDFSQDGSLIISGSGDKTVRIWNMTTHACRVFTTPDADLLLNNNAGVASIAISPDNRYVAAGCLDTVVRVWEVTTGQMVGELKGHHDSVYSIAYTPDGRGLVSGGLDMMLKYWDLTSLVSSGEISKVKEMPSPGSYAVAPNSNSDEKDVNADGPGNREKGQGGRPLVATKVFVGHRDYVFSVVVSSNGRWIVTGSKDQYVRFWDAASTTMHCMLRGHENPVISVDLNPAGGPGLLATGSGDYSAKIWGYTVI